MINAEYNTSVKILTQAEIVASLMDQTNAKLVSIYLEEIVYFLSNGKMENRTRPVMFRWWVWASGINVSSLSFKLLI